MGFLKKLTRGLFAAGKITAGGITGARVYAVGDVHGRLDLLEDLIQRIEQDIASRPRAKTFIVFLGDLIDRGPDSAGVVERLRTYRPDSARPVFLCGNHEEVLLRILAGERGVLRSWLSFGGTECAASYGLDVDRLKGLDEGAALDLIGRSVPASHHEFLKSFGDTFRFGDYVLVHAGIRPGIALDEQEIADLRWIREPFLGDSKEHGFVVVHGHTISTDVEERRNRIGIDTGAYRSGILTALAIQDRERWYLKSEGDGNTARISQPATP